MKLWKSWGVVGIKIDFFESDSQSRMAQYEMLAGLAAKGKTTLYGVEHIDRGYENVCGNLRCLGARIRRSRENSDAV